MQIVHPLSHLGDFSEPPILYCRETDRVSPNPECLICTNINKINRCWSTGRYRLLTGGNNIPLIPVVILPTSTPSHSPPPRQYPLRHMLYLGDSTTMGVRVPVAEV